MTKVKLRKGIRSYTTRYDGKLINASQEKNIIDVEDSAAEYLVSTGYFDEVPQPENVNDDVDIDFDNSDEDNNSEDEEDEKYADAPKTVDLDKMKKEDLIAYAKENEINIDGLTTKAEIKEAILNAINAGVPEIFTE